MANIIGESFKEYVANQVEIRQQNLGKANNSNDALAFLSGKTPFLKLTSGIDVSPKKCREIGLPESYAGNELAKTFLLFGGTSFKEGDSTRLRLGVASNYDDLFANVSYGMASNSDYGLVPMPGLVGASIKSKNKGSLRECEIKIKCFNKVQFNLIETLFLRLKYSFLLEWGHTIYYDNNNEVITTPSSLSDFYLEGGNTQTELLDEIEKTREASGGNYDAFLGYVVNFSWDLNPDGSYDITVKGSTPGDVIESLKINVLKHDSPSETNDEDDEAPSVVKDKDKSTLNLIFHALNEKAAEGDSWLTGELSIVTLDTIYSSFLKEKIPKLGEIKGDLKSKYESFLSPGGQDFSALGANADIFSSILDQTNLVSREAVRLEFGFDDDSTGEEQLYIKFGALCRFIEMYCLMYDKGSTKYAPIVGIDNDYFGNYCFTLPEQFSTDPRICMIPVAPTQELEEGLDDSDNLWNSFWSWTGAIDSASDRLKELNDALSTEFKDPREPFVGNMMHIHINANYISTILSDQVDEKGNLSLYDFFTILLQGVQRALGGINEFEVIYNEDTNTVRFMDNTQIPGVFKISEEEGVPPTPTRLNVNTFKLNEGSFVKDVKIKSEITKDIASMMTIGAQSNGNVVGENATAFSNWNVGLTDRVMKEKQNATDDPETTTSEGEQTTDNTKSPEEQFAEYREKVLKYLLRVVKLKLDEDDIDTYSTSFRPYLNYIVGNLSKETTDPTTGEKLPAKIPPIGFIPLSLDLTMLGISGIKIYQKYTINEELLPPNYVNKIEFLTKGVSHTISQDGWTTSIDGQTVPKNDTSATEDAASSQKIASSNTGQSQSPYQSPSQAAQSSPGTQGQSPQFEVDENADDLCPEIVANAPRSGGEPTSTYRRNNGLSRLYSPVGDQDARITSGYTGQRSRNLTSTGVYKSPRPHRGIDIDITAPPEKYPVYAIWDGTIIQATSGGGGFRTIYRLDSDTLRRDAPYIFNNLASDYSIENNEPKYSAKGGGVIYVTYYHQEPKNESDWFGTGQKAVKGKDVCLAPGIFSGAKVKRGQFLGVADNTGGSTAAHLHVNLMVGPPGSTFGPWVFGDNRQYTQLDPKTWLYIKGVN